MSRTFVLGVGAQKAGTTWLYEQLSQCSGFKAGWKKEYHIWDAREVPELMGGQRKLWKTSSLGYLDMYLMEKSPSRYFDHFRRLLSKENTLACDITPSYSALAPDTFSQIKQGMVDREITFKCLFIMRDPVRRCLSAFNMKRNRGGGRGIAYMSEDVDAAFMQFVQTDYTKIRTEYERTIAALRKGLAPEDYRIQIYEEMFDPAQIKALQAYLGLTFRVESPQDRVFSGDYTETVSAQAQAFCRDSFAATYDDVAQSFPQVKTLWAG